MTAAQASPSTTRKSKLHKSPKPEPAVPISIEEQIDPPCAIDSAVAKNEKNRNNHTESTRDTAVSTG